MLSERQKSEIVATALAHYEAVSRNDPDKMNLWGYKGPHMHTHLDKARDGLDALISHASGEIHISVAAHTSSSLWGVRTERHLRHLASTGFDLFGESNLSESPLLNPGVLFELHGRLLSTDFLYRLCILRHIERSAPEFRSFRTVLEIGAGLGQLARATRLMNPGVTHVIIDLPETLIFSGSSGNRVGGFGGS